MEMTNIREHCSWAHLDDYEGARALIAERLQQLRETAGFTEPDYDRIRRKSFSRKYPSRQ